MRRITPSFLCGLMLLLMISALSGQWRPPVDPEGKVDFQSSTLPIIIIDTGGKAIVDAVRVPATMKIIDNGRGAVNTTADPPNGFDGRIAVELRGSSSASYAKKQYRLETQDENGRDLDVSLLGLPQESDWILSGPYSDETHIRNALAYKLSNRIGRYAPRTRFCEVVVNGDYRGIYLLVEKIKRDKNRVAVAKLDSADIEGTAVTGGYIIKIDKAAGENVGGWTSAKRQPYQYDYPKANEIRPEQKAYIKQFIDRFEASMYADWNVDRSFLQLIDIDSFVDHFILNEFCKNIDAYRISAYMHKDRDDRDGRLVMGPIWDFDLSMGKAFFPQDFGLYEGWQIDYRQTHPFDGYQVPLWWEKLAHSDIFQPLVENRWRELRRTTLSQDSLNAEIDGLVSEIAEALPRNFQKYPAVLRNGATYEDRLRELKEWIVLRLRWIDEHIGSLAPSAGVSTSQVYEFRLEQNYPNPFNPATVISFSLPVKGRAVLDVFDLLGRHTARLVDADLYPGVYSVNFHADGLPSGVYFYRLQAAGQTLQRRMLHVE